MRLLRLLVACATAALLVLGVGPAQAAERDFRPGAAGAGDPYWPHDGNGGFDVRHYDLRLRYLPPGVHLTGVATITARATQDLSSFHLDARALDVSAVTVAGRPARFAIRGQELVVDPAGPGLRRGRTFRTVVTYTADPTPIDTSPEEALTGVFTTSDGFVIAGEPHGASTWFPVSDHPTDKASYRFHVTVPQGLQAVANGNLVARSRGDGTTTFVWDSPTFMASYLATVDVGHWTFTRDRADGARYVYAIDSALAETDTGREALAHLRREPEMVAYLQSVFGPYPWHAAGGIVDADPGLSFALETQTRPVFARIFFEGDQLPYADTVVLHELAHQWYGDSVSVRRWSDIWLNEGFATYAEWLWTEHEGGTSASQQLRETYAAYPADDPIWRVRIGDPGTHLFTGALYGRGVMAVGALRERIGDDAFFRLLRRWPALHHRGNAGLADFEALAERLSGRRLDGFLRAWLLTPRRPALD